MEKSLLLKKSFGTEIFKKEPFQELDATGKHLTRASIDEHSHIAIDRGVNEGSQASSAEVSIANVVKSTISTFIANFLVV